MKPSPAEIHDRMIGHLLKLNECHPSGKPILLADVRVWTNADWPLLNDADRQR